MHGWRSAISGGRDRGSRGRKYGSEVREMAWGYWSATTVSDRGRSPRREKDKQHQQGLHQQQQPQQFHQTESGVYGIVQQVQSDLGVVSSASGPGAGAAAEEPPCSMMIQGGSFYSYSAATAAAAAAAAGRRVPPAVEGPSTSSTAVQVLPRDRPAKSSTSTYPPSPGSDSAEYEQPMAGPRDDSPQISPRDEIFAQPGSSRSRTKLLCDKGVDDASEDDGSEEELDEITAAKMMYASTNRARGTNTCRLHRARNPPLDPAAPIPPLIDDEFWFNDITWGRS